VNPALAEWAQRFHATCEALPIFGRLAAECRGDPAAAAAATEAILRLVDLPPPDAPSPAASPGSSADPLRGPLVAACAAASRAVDELREAMEGLASVAFGNVPGTAGVPNMPQEGSAVRTLAARLRRDHRLQRIALLAGRFKSIAAAKRRQRVKHGADEITAIEQDADLGRALPAELAQLSRPLRRLDFMRSLLERAHAERRPFALIEFNGHVTYETTVGPGGELPHEALFVSCGGGTSIAAAFERGLEIIAQHPGALRRSDIVLITDGGSDPERAPELRHLARGLEVTSLGLSIEVAAETLAPWCDEAHAVSSVSTLEENVARPLFSS
jgi:hypothetical protein